jgi:transmembrane sensor
MSMSTSDEDECLEQPDRREAAAWWIRGHCGDLNPAERYELVRWCKTSPSHVAELLRAVRIYLLLESVRPLHNVNEDQFAQVISLRASSFRPATLRSRLRPWLIGGAAVAASILGILLSVSYLTHSVTTNANEWRSFQLGDGSRVTVGPRSQLRHTLDDHERRVELNYGEVLLQVARDRTRPFLVEAGSALISATGTQFAVDRRPHSLRVTLAEGSVVVKGAGGAGSSAVTLHPGEELHVTNQAPARIRRVDTVRSLAWASRMIILNDETIESAVAEFNQRNSVQIEIPPAIARRAIHGTFYADDPESFALSVAIATKRVLVRERMRLRIGEEQREHDERSGPMSLPK